MDRFNIPLTAERLTAYAVERQSGTERHQPEGTPPPAELRRFWTDAILQGMARLEGLTPASKWMDQYDQQLEAAGIPAGLIRMSCGLENKADLIEDIQQALEAI